MGLEWNDDFMPEFRARVVVPSLDKAMLAAERYARTNIQRRKPRVVNRTVIRGGRRRTVTREIKNRSRPGEFPNTDTGHLRNSLTTAKTDPTGRTLVASFGLYGGVKRPKQQAVYQGTARGYGMYLERGTRPPHNMKPRPFLIPTMKKAPIAETFADEARNRFGEMIR